MSDYEKSITEFCLTAPTPKEKKRHLPKNVVGLEVATPLEQIVTIIVLIRNNQGDILRVPVGFAPSTKVTKRMHDESWVQLGIEEGTSKIRNSVTKMAKSEHKKAFLKYSTYDMFNDEITQK